MEEIERRLADLETQIDAARINQGVMRHIITHALGFIVVQHGDQGRAFVEGLKVHDGPLLDPQADGGRARPDYAARFHGLVDQIADRALSATRE